MGMELNQSAPDLIVCCNGALPYANMKAIWPAEDVHFEQFRLNDTNVGSDTNLTGISGPRCLGYLLKLSDPELLSDWTDANGTLGCRCKRDFYGRHCVDQRAAHGANTQAGGSFKVFLFLAIVPLTFGLVAAIGGLLCKLCCCRCRTDDADDISTGGDPMSLGFCWCCFYAEDEIMDESDGHSHRCSPPPLEVSRKSPRGRRRAPSTDQQNGRLAQSDTTEMLLAPVDFNFDLPPPTYRQIFAFDPSPPPYSNDEQLRDATTQTNL